MPNHVATKITFVTTEPQTILDRVKTDKSAFDFNTLIPMPLSLLIDSRSDGETAMEYMLFLADFMKSYRDKEGVKRATEYLERNSEARELGKQYLINIALHGNKNWYDWSNKHWRTKWPAYEIKISQTPLGDQSVQVDIEFQTAWAVPWPILTKFAEIVPSFDIKYADECPNFWGSGSFIDGSLTILVEDNDNERLPIFEELWGYNCDADDESDE